MASITEECKKWINYVQQLDFETCIESLQNTKNIKRDEESNKILFKFLMHLSHSADRCCKEKLSKEIQIYTIAKIICENLTRVTDKHKLFSAIYYITYYLISKQFFKEAKIINSYVLPGRIIDADDAFESSKYYQIGYLWYTEIFKKLDEQAIKYKTSQKCSNEDLSIFIQFHLQILKYCDESFKYVLIAFDAYMKKCSTVPLIFVSKYIVLLFKEISSYINQLKKVPVTEAYSILIPAVGIAFYKRDDAIDNKIILECFRECDAFFLEALKISSQCYNSYKLFREYSLNVLETNFMSQEIGEVRFKKTFDILKILMDKYGTENESVTNTVTGLVCSFETVFNKWETLISKELTKTKITYEDILKMGEFVKCAYSFLKNRKYPSNYTCKKCPTATKCPMEKDIYNAGVAVSSYLRLISKFKSNELNEKIFTLAKDMIVEMLSGYNELKESGCKYSVSMWDMCGRTIFNIGLISETNYPKEYEELYEVLCKQIVQYDGLESRIGSFGLESPVATTLNRLCNVNLNQENYRRAMSYTAYNAILSTTDSRKKKAYDTWCTIKLKCLDSKEIQELTLVNCLKTDKSVAKDVGINIDLDRYDIKNLYLEELKSLFSAKGNLTTSMQKTLAELEPIENDLYYARGVLLLCFHSLQHYKRKYIINYITKAIKKLSAIRPRTPSNICLIASLNFFNILEKLHAKRQAINEQMEDANFTVKSFKVLRGKHIDYEIEEQDEIVPTYGNISIEEDKRIAKEFQDVLNTWNIYIFLQKDLTAIINDWEPELMLETIVLCGEYCRLFKFNRNEEMAWNIAYKLATALKNYTTCLYVTGRSISLRYINDIWIKNAEKYVELFKNSSKTAEIDPVILFWLSLADFYLDCNKVEEAKELLEKVQKVPDFKLIGNSKMYIYATDIRFRNYFLLNTEISQEDYCKLLVEMHYMLINLNDYLSQETFKFWYIKYRLFSLEQMFEVMCNITIPMYSLLSYREIYAHLIYGLQHAQKSGMTLRIAQYLKYYCYIFLLRNQKDEVEAKLQDLEHILGLEQFQISQKSNHCETTNTVQTTSTRPIRGTTTVVLKNGGASPELRRKVFSKPSFLVDEPNCQCFTCMHLTYQYLTFSCVYIRAQLYSILDYFSEAEQHFHGANLIRVCLENRDTPATRQYKKYKWKRHQSFDIDELYYILDFSMFLSDFMPKKRDSALAVIEEALSMAKATGLDKHPVGLYAMELYIQHYAYEVFGDKLVISSDTEIPITITNQPVSGCLTPKHQVERAPRNQRRRKSPPAVAIPVITIEESTEATQELVAKSVTDEVVKPKRTSARLVRRKLLVDEVDESPKNENEQPVPVRKRSVRLASKSGTK